MADLVRETDPKKRRAIIERLQAMRKDLRGFKPGPYLYFWNAWLAK